MNIKHYKYIKRASKDKYFKNRNTNETYRILRYNEESEIVDFEEVDVITNIVWEAPEKE